VLLWNWDELSKMRCKDCGAEFATTARNAMRCQACRINKAGSRKAAASARNREAMKAGRGSKNGSKDASALGNEPCPLRVTLAENKPGLSRG